jgi:hypothetical protein
VKNLAFVLWAFVAVGASLAAWSLATPVMAAPDEPAHVIQAAAVVRGQLDGPQKPTDVGSAGVVKVPEWTAMGRGLQKCFAFRPRVPAGCAPKLASRTTTVRTTTEFSNYPPLYYLIVGVASLFLAGAPAVYAMRLVGDLVNAGLIALGLILLARYHPRRSPLAGALIALAPMVLFVTSVVNSSGLEVAAAFAAWCGGLCVVEHRPVPPALAICTSLSFFFLILSRPISPAEAAIIVAVLAALAGWRNVRMRVHDRSLRSLWFSGLVSVIVAGVFLLIGGQPHLLGVPAKPPLTLARAIWTGLRQTGPRLRQCIGQFGWLDTPVPSWVVVVWTFAVGAFSAVALTFSSACRRALPLLALAVLVMPAILEAPKVNAVGFYWQGRYWLPIIMGLPLVASAIQGRPWHVRTHVGAKWPSAPPVQVVGLLCLGVTLIVAQTVAFQTALRRYQTGLGTPPGTHVSWSPPGGASIVLALFIAGQVLLLGFVLMATLRRPSPIGTTRRRMLASHRSLQIGPADALGTARGEAG